MSDLTQRLRSPMAVFYHHDVDDGALLREAADRIETLEAEVERLTARVKELEGVTRLGIDAVPLHWLGVARAALAGEGGEDG